MRHEQGEQGGVHGVRASEYFPPSILVEAQLGMGDRRLTVNVRHTRVTGTPVSRLPCPNEVRSDGLVGEGGSGSPSRQWAPEGRVCLEEDELVVSRRCRQFGRGWHGDLLVRRGSGRCRQAGQRDSSWRCGSCAVRHPPRRDSSVVRRRDGGETAIRERSRDTSVDVPVTPWRLRLLVAQAARSLVCLFP